MSLALDVLSSIFDHTGKSSKAIAGGAVTAVLTTAAPLITGNCDLENIATQGWMALGAYVIGRAATWWSPANRRF